MAPPWNSNGLLFNRPRLYRMNLELYNDEGSTTIPLHMMLQNCISKYHIVEAAVQDAVGRNQEVRMDMHELVSGLRHDLEKVREFIYREGEDFAGVYDVPDWVGERENTGASGGRVCRLGGIV